MTTLLAASCQSLCPITKIAFKSRNTTINSRPIRFAHLRNVPLAILRSWSEDDVSPRPLVAARPVSGRSQKSNRYRHSRQGRRGSISAPPDATSVYSSISITADDAFAKGYMRRTSVLSPYQGTYRCMWMSTGREQALGIHNAFTVQSVLSRSRFARFMDAMLAMSSL